MVVSFPGVLIRSADSRRVWPVDLTYGRLLLITGEVSRSKFCVPSLLGLRGGVFGTGIFGLATVVLGR